VAAGTSGELNLGTAYTTSAQVGNLSLGAGATLSVTRSGSFAPNAAYSITAGPLAVAGSATLNVADDGSGQGTLSVGPLSGSGSLTVNGPGTLVLTSSANGFTGQTILNGCTLVVSNGTAGSATGTRNVTLNSGMLASDPNVGGTIAGSVTAGNGLQQIAPGGIGAINTLTIGGNLALNSSSTLDFDVNGGSADALSIGGSLSVTGLAAVALNTIAVPPSSLTLATFKPNSPAGTSNFSFTGMPEGYTLQVASGSLSLVPFVGTPTWGALSGSWSNGGNWTGGAAPSGAGFQAIVGNGTPTPATITLDGAQTVGELTFANAVSGTTGFTLAAGASGTLTMNNSFLTAQIAVSSGVHGISAPVILAGNLSVTPTTGTTLNISGNISEETPGTGTLSLEGPGTLVLSGSNTYTGGTFVWSGTLQVSSSAALADGSSLSVGANLGDFGLTPDVAVATPGAMAAVPEPAALALLGVAGIVAAAAAWRRRRSKN
jgi:autotransporter-associated beta strand protein